MLEIVDGAFDDIAREVDEYKAAIASKTPSQLAETEINSISLHRYLQELVEQHELNIDFVEIPDDVLAEVKAYGLHTIGDLKQLADDETLCTMRTLSTEDENLIGFVRTLMMYQNIDRYFSIWKYWTVLDAPTASLLEKKYGRSRLREILADHNVTILGEDDS